MIVSITLNNGTTAIKKRFCIDFVGRNDLIHEHMDLILLRGTLILIYSQNNLCQHHALALSFTTSTPSHPLNQKKLKVYFPQKGIIGPGFSGHLCNPYSLRE